MSITYSADKHGIRLGETKVCDFWTQDKEGIAALIRRANAADELADALQRAVPYLEDAKGDACYKPGAVAKFIRECREAITRFDGGK